MSMSCLALALSDHEFHSRVALWMKPRRMGDKLSVASCSITELGFVRILSQPVYRYSLHEARDVLNKLKAIRDLDFAFLADNQSAADLPDWVTKPGHVTDGHLSELAKAHGAVLATLDSKIPAVFLIPG